jgi:hypothetical protein
MLHPVASRLQQQAMAALLALVQPGPAVSARKGGEEERATRDPVSAQTTSWEP